MAGMNIVPVDASKLTIPIVVVEPEMLPWAKQFVMEVDANDSLNDPEARCLPSRSCRP